MRVPELPVRERIALFKQSISADLYAAEDIVDFPGAMSAVASYEVELLALDDLLKKSILDSTTLSEVLLAHPRLYSALCSLLSISASIQLEDGRILPSPVVPPRTVEAAKKTAEVLLELGLTMLLAGEVNIRKLLLVVQIAGDAPRRRFRVDARIKDRIAQAVDIAIKEVAGLNGIKLSLVASSSLPASARRIIEYVIAVDGTPRIAIASTFQTHSGGRQTRDMSTLFPNVQSTLQSSGVALLLVADGQGMKSLSDRVLLELFAVVPQTMSITQAEHDGLRDGICALLSTPAAITVDTAGLVKLVDSALQQGTRAIAASLPVSEASARLALANYASSHNHLDLTLSPEGMELTWRNSELIATLRQLTKIFDASATINAAATLFLGACDDEMVNSIDFASALSSLADDAIFGYPFLMCATSAEADAELLREVARHALQRAPGAKVALLLVFRPISASMHSVLRDAQNFLAVTIVVVDLNTILSMAQSREQPRSRLQALLLEQTDLTKLSPFVVRGVTPERVFFGREEEEATLLSTLSTNSVALLGGRRIGKTSLLRHSSKRLEVANFKPHFGDCQVVRTWADFGLMASRNWNVELPTDFKPKHLLDLVNKLKDTEGRSTVILLDEIDQLLDWDKAHTDDDQVPEAFFRACRAISQDGAAQFVFSGERTIANRLWDASSPHWNFCRPLMLRQLNTSEAASLMADPLEALGVRIDERDDFLKACWACTDGHPELLQLIGDKIVGLINQRERRNVYTCPEDVLHVSTQFDYAEQYLETYWGQATDLERVVSILLLEGVCTLDRLVAHLDHLTHNVSGENIQSALHMLDLYGIARQTAKGYELRAIWFSTALNFYGGPESAINRYIGKLKS
jgi:hypothetical protein